MATEETPVVNVNEGRSNDRPVLRIVLGLALLLPAILFWIGGLLVPTISTVVVSLQKGGAFGGAVFVGMENYARLFQDPRFTSALGFTLLLVVVRVLVVAVAPLLLSLAVNEFGRAVRVPVRLLFTVPLAMFAPTATAIVWGMVLHPHLGLTARGWLADPETARMAFLLVDSLTTFGLACGVGLIFYLAALRGGKKVWAPLLVSWATGLLATIALTLQSFAMSYALMRGGPMDRTMTLMLYQFDAAFLQLRSGVGAAVATLVLVVVTSLGLIAGLIVILAGLRLELTPRERKSGLLTREGKRKGIAVVSLVLVLLLSLGCCLPSALPWPWDVLNSLKTQADIANSSLLPSSPSLDAYALLADRIPVGRVWVNTLSSLLSMLLLQIPIVYLGALGIGAIRPLKRWSELLLLPFSPWLFVTVGPLSIVAFGKLRNADALGTVAALVPPIVLSVPALFVLTWFFKGREPQWRAAQAEGQSPLRTFFTELVRPSLPLVLLLACVSLLVGLQDLLWPLVVARGPETLTVNLALMQLRSSVDLSWPMLAAAVVRLGLPAFLFFFLAFGLIQALYLDRLARVTRSRWKRVEGEVEDEA